MVLPPSITENTSDPISWLISLMFNFSLIINDSLKLFKHVLIIYMSICELHMLSILNMPIFIFIYKSFSYMKDMKALSLVLLNIFLGILCFNEFLESYTIEEYLTEFILMLLLQREEPPCCNLFSLDPT